MKIVVIAIEKKYIIRLWEPLRLYMGGWVPLLMYVSISGTQLDGYRITSVSNLSIYCSKIGF